MKITNIRFEDLVERTTNNDLIEDDKNILIEIFEPQKYKHNPSLETLKKQSEWRRNKYHTDEEYRLNRIEQAKEYHQKKFEELGIEKQPKGRLRKYETKEEANQANLANIKRIYHEKKTTTNKVGRPSLSLEDKIKPIEKHTILYLRNKVKLKSVVSRYNYLFFKYIFWFVYRRQACTK